MIQRPVCDSHFFPTYAPTSPDPDPDELTSAVMLAPLLVIGSVALLQPALHPSRVLPLVSQPQCCRAAVRCNVAEPPSKLSENTEAFPAIFKQIESALVGVTGDPQKLLEAVVGLPGGVAKYDRDGIVDYFIQRPQLMVQR